MKKIKIAEKAACFMSAETLFLAYFFIKLLSF